MAPTEKSEKLTVLAGPMKIDGDAWRLVSDADGTRSEMWEAGKGWVASKGAGMPADEFFDPFFIKPPVSKEFAASIGMPLKQ